MKRLPLLIFALSLCSQAQMLQTIMSAKPIAQDTGITFTPPAGAVSNPTTVTFSGAIAGSIYCSTQDGSTPVSNGVGTACVVGTAGNTTSITTAVTVKAISALLGELDSPVSSAAYTISGGGGTFSVAQHTVAIDHGCGGSISCAFTITATGTGNALVVMAHTFNSSATTIYSSITGGGGSWVNDTNCSAAVTSPSFFQNFCIYNLSPTAGTTSLTFNVTTQTPDFWAIEVFEFHWTGSSITYATGASSGATAETCSSSTCAGVSVGTLTGSNVIIQSMQIVSNGITAITGGAGYTTYQDFLASYGSGFAAAINTTTGTAPTWSDTTPDTGIANAIVLKGN